MKNKCMLIPRLRLAGVLLVAAILGGCASQPTLYQWNGYQDNVDAYLRGDKRSLAEQVQVMETDLEEIIASGRAVPPGYYAHLGLLYGQQGKLDQFAVQMQAEKKQYPESGPFMDFLLRNFKK